MTELYLHALVYPWPLPLALVALIAALGRWRLDSPWQLVDVVLGALMGALLAGRLSLTWGMPYLDELTSLDPWWRWPLYVGAGLAMGLALPLRGRAESMAPGLVLGFVLTRARLTDADLVLSWSAVPFAVVGLFWLVAQRPGPNVGLRIAGGALVAGSPAIVAAQVGVGRLTAGVTLLVMLGASTVRRASRR